ncbi:major capsid protein [Pyruvatibacter sp.]|uniref:major capsid protein n=1 Tax=Pyruvatibacter sp. TaxID=1981328 RepID=UPI0032EB6EDF
MAPLTNSGARVVDPILTNHSRGYSHPERVGRVLFPVVPVPVRGFKRIEFSKESFLRYNTRRAPGAATKSMTFGYEGLPASISQYALNATVPREHVQEAAAGPGIDLQMEAVSAVQDVISLDEECEQAELALDASKYDAANKITLAGNDQWSDPDSDPKAVINDGKEAVRKKIGRDANTLVLPPAGFRALDDHPKLLEKLKYTSSDSITTAILARYFDVETVVVGRAVYAATPESDFTDVWGDKAVLAYVAPAGARSVRVPSFGYTYQLTGHPFVEPMRWDPDTKSWVAGVTDERSAELVGAEAGYLISDLVA